MSGVVKGVRLNNYQPSWLIEYGPNSFLWEIKIVKAGVKQNSWQRHLVPDDLQYNSWELETDPDILRDHTADLLIEAYKNGDKTALRPLIDRLLELL